MSNYPPGVTGNEYEISGPEHEWEESVACGNCDVYAVQTLQTHWSKGTWFVCTKCDALNDLGFAEDRDDAGPDPDAWYDEQRDREYEERYG